MPLDGRQRGHLRSLGHHLDPVVQVGKLGVTEALVAAADEALLRHELIKVRCGRECPVARPQVADLLCTALGAEMVQSLGRVLLLYRPNPDTPRIVLP